MAVRRIATALAVAGLAVPGATAAAADTTSGPLFSFAETTALVTSCADLFKGVDVEVRNDSAVEQTLHLRFGPVRDSTGATRARPSVCGGLSAKIAEPAPVDADGQSAKVGPGSSAMIQLTGVPPPKGSKAPKKPPSEAFSTTLIVYADAGLVARRTVTVSETKGIGVEAMPLADSRSVTHERYNPADDWQIWLPVKLKPGDTPSLVRGKSVGVLTGSAGTTDVIYDGGRSKKLSDSTSLLPLRVEAVGAGTYTGKLTLAAGGTTTVTLTVKHWWLFVCAILFAGIAVALAIQRQNGFSAPRDRLFERVDDLSTEHEEAVARLIEAAKAEPWKGFDLVGVPDKQVALRKEIDKKTKLRTVFQIDQKVIDALGAKIDAVGTEIGLLDKLTDAAGNLDAALATLSDPNPADLPPLRGRDREHRKPALVAAAHTLEEGKPLPADELSETVDKLTAMRVTVDTLHDDQHELAHCWSQAGDLAQELRDPEQLRELESLVMSLIGVRHQLWTGDSADSLDVDDALDEARDTIRKLWAYLPEAPELERFARVGNVYLDEGVEAVDGEPPTMPTKSGVSAADPDKIINGAALRQLAVIGASTAVAFVTGINALYVGKPWGTPWDYVTALAWGLTTQTAITALAGAIDGLGPIGALRFGVGAHPKTEVAQP